MAPDIFQESWAGIVLHTFEKYIMLNNILLGAASPIAVPDGRDPRGLI